MRGTAGLAYLLARTSDTLADSAAAPAAIRMECLARLARAISGDETVSDWPNAVVEGIDDSREKQLLGVTPLLLEFLRELPAAEAALIREVTGIIISGQQLDLQRFAEATPSQPVALASAGELDDYTWRVAGCVGVFWTRLAHQTLGDAFSSDSIEIQIQRSIRYGRALQLVNILRDLRADLAQGRCYLPVKAPSDADQLLTEHARWLAMARGHLDEGFAYASALCSHRLRAASALPALIARDTLDLLAAAGPAVLQQRLKVPRSAIYRSLVRAVLWRGDA